LLRITHYFFLRDERRRFRGAARFFAGRFTAFLRRAGRFFAAFRRFRAAIVVPPPSSENFETNDCFLS